MGKEHRTKIIAISALAILLISGRAFTGEADTPHNQNHHDYKHHGGHHRFTDAETWAKMFEGPERDAWQKPEAVIKALDLKQDTIIADIRFRHRLFPCPLCQGLPERQGLRH
jgi:hypothetical protein